jgi:hypothetical protein
MAPSPIFAINGGAPGAKASVAAAGAVVATLDDTTSVRSVEWDIVGTDETSSPASYTLVVSGSFDETCTTTALAAGTAAILRCRINSGIGVNGNNSPETTIATAKFFVPLANGGEVGAKDETYESDPVRGTTALLNQGIRAAAALGAGPVASVAGTAPIVSSGGASPAISITAASGSAAGSMSSAHYTLLAGATAAATATTLVERDASGDFAAHTMTAHGLAISDLGIQAASDIATTPVTDTYAATITMRGKDGGQHNITLTGNVAFAAPTLYGAGSTLHVFIRQGGAGSFTATWAGGAGGFYFPAGLSGTLAATVAGDADYLEFKHSTLPSSHWVCINHLHYTTP